MQFRILPVFTDVKKMEKDVQPLNTSWLQFFSHIRPGPARHWLLGDFLQCIRLIEALNFLFFRNTHSEELY